MKVDLLPVGQPNGNGRIYPRALLEEAIKRMHSKTVLIRHSVKAFTYPDMETLTLAECPVEGEATNLRVENRPVDPKPDGKEIIAPTVLTCDVNILSDEIKAKIESGEIAVRTAGIGTYSEDDTTIESYELTGLFLTNNPA